MGLVVERVSVNSDSPLPDEICAGLKLHVVSAGNLEQDRLTLFGNTAVVGATSRL